MRSKKIIQNLILAIEIVLFFAAFATLTGGKGVDFDEAFSWDIIVNNNIAGILSGTAADVHPPLYYLIVKLNFAVFGASLRVMVWASIIPVLLGMILISVFVNNRWGFKSAFLFNLVYGFSPFILHYNLNLRMYSWMDLFVLGVILVSYEIVLEHKRWHYVALFLFSIMAVYTQYFAVLPIVICYVWLFAHFLKGKDYKGLIKFLTVGVLDVVTYIPWLMYGMSNMGISHERLFEEYSYSFSPSEIFEIWFKTNLEKSELMAGSLLVFAIISFILLRNRYAKSEKSFVIMLLVNSVFCWYFSQLLGSLNGHFFNPRYVIYCLVCVWLFMAIVFSRFKWPVYGLFFLWTLEMCSSSYLVERAYEYDTTPLMDKTVDFIESNVDSDAVIVYDYDKWYNLIWQYYIPGHEFIPFEELNLDDMRGQTFWLINLSGTDFSDDEIREYSLEIEHNPDMGFMGMQTFDLWKVECK